jgi:hypothetical protein
MIKSIGEILEDIYYQKTINEMKAEAEIQNAIAQQTIQAIKRGDIKSINYYKNLIRIKMETNIIFSDKAKQMYDQLKRKDQNVINKYLNSDFINKHTRILSDNLFMYKITPHIRFYASIYENNIIITEFIFKNYIYNDEENLLKGKSEILLEKNIEEIFSKQLEFTHLVHEQNYKKNKFITNIFIILTFVILISILIIVAIK